LQHGYDVGASPLCIGFDFDKTKTYSFVDLAAIAGDIENTKAGIGPKMAQRTNKDLSRIVLAKYGLQICKIMDHGFNNAAKLTRNSPLTQFVGSA
jgi:hypothetical protein